MCCVYLEDTVSSTYVVCKLFRMYTTHPRHMCRNVTTGFIRQMNKCLLLYHYIESIQSELAAL